MTGTKGKPEVRPLRDVLPEKSRVKEGRGSILGPDTSRRTRWFELHLSCGHMVERDVRYVPTGYGWSSHRALADALPMPRRARCDSCPRRAL